MAEKENARDIVTLRELVEEKLKFVHLRIDGLRELLDAQRTAAAQALQLQATETDKHLEKLNGEQARMQQERDRTLPRETFDTWRDSTDKQIGEHTRQLANVLGRTQGISGAWALGVAAAAALAACGTLLELLLRR